MRFEEKEVDGPELEHEEEYERENELEEEDEEELPAIEPEKTLDTRHEGEVMEAMRAILEHRQIVINDLHLPQRELRALEALQAAVRGRDGKLDQFVYASDRRDLLEQALAILQPALIQNLGQPFEQLVHEVAHLRHELKDLEDAQDELLEANRQVGLEQGETDSDDKPKPPEDDDTSLTGPERKIAKPASSLEGPERKDAPRPASTLDGPERKDAPKPPSSLYGDEVVDKAQPSTLDGPAIPEAAPVASSLGSTEDLEAANAEEPQKKKPWWRRPFG